MELISASVGMHNGKQCYNVLKDQQTVTYLLNVIPRSEGGAEGSLPPPAIWGIVSPVLHRAILDFQRANHLSVDGHIDPRGAAIRLMNDLIDGKGTSEVGHPPVCGPLRRVYVGIIRGASASVFTVLGGPTGLVKLIGISTALKIEIELTVPGYHKVDSYPVTPHSPSLPLFDVGMPPPVRWQLSLRAPAGAVAAVTFEFHTDWLPGDPPCTPPR